MIRKIIPVLGLSIFLSGCGTLVIDIDYGATPAVELEELTAPSPSPEPTASPAGTATPSPSPTRPAAITVEAIASPLAEVKVAGLAASRSHTCAVLSDGTVKCWGNNEDGQLGDGSMVSRNTPVTVAGLAGVKTVAAGWGHTCALTQAGAVLCWGNDSDGELGDGGNTDSSRPVNVAGLSSGVISIDAGDYHTCAVTVSHTLRCWGRNTYGQLGDWTKNNAPVPVESPFFGGGVADVAAGWGHTCVQTIEGWVKCWGNNASGQMGFGKLTDIHLPAEDVVNLPGRVLSVTADGSQTCAVTAGGGAQCWGENRYGQLGDGSTTNRNEPAQVVWLTSGVGLLKAGGNHACAVVSGGELRCWGWNFYGQIGDGTMANRNLPYRVAFLTDGVKDIALGWGHTCVLTSLGAVRCWGLNGSGQLGDGTWTDSLVPLTVIGL